MSKKFKCYHCQRWCTKNPRIKGKQKYCGAKECQQARKDLWEQEKLQNDPAYKVRRQAAKRRWYSKYPGYKYQSKYRKTHPEYCKENREKQILRNQKRQILEIVPKIVKTDTLSLKRAVSQDLYVLVPYKKAAEKTDAKKIVKTDALIVQMVATQQLAGDFLSDSS